MLLVIDLGNTCLKLSLYQEDKLYIYKRFFTRSTTLINDLTLFLKENHFLISEIWISSVVYDIRQKILPLLKSYKVHFLNCDDNLGISVATANKKEVGSDLLALSAYAYHKYKCPLLILSMGTASVFIYLNKTGKLLYVSILPGYNAYRNALFKDTDLTNNKLNFQNSYLTSNTKDALSLGIVNGYTALIKHFIKQYQKELNTNFLLIGCGGSLEEIKEYLPKFNYYNSDLVSLGLAYCYKRSKYANISS